MAHIFISYKRDVEPDQPFALALHQRLRPAHTPFIDQEILVGQSWVQRIQSEIESADFLVLLISRHSIESGMVAQEVKIATEAARRRSGRPSILPVRLDYDGELPYDVAAVVNRLQYAVWRSPADTERVLGDLLDAIDGRPGRLLEPDDAPRPPLPVDVPVPAANPLAAVALEVPGGTMRVDSPFYVPRPADALVMAEMRRDAYTLTIQGARQMGKSSLLGRVIASARQAGCQVAFVDFQGLGDLQSMGASDPYRLFAAEIEQQLDLDTEIAQLWNAELAPPQACTRFMERCILKAVGGDGLLLAIDEADRLMCRADSNSFFGMLRSWCNLRSLNPRWQHFNLAFAISTEAGMLIDDIHQSPFNVGIAVELEDFSATEFGALDTTHGALLQGPQREQLYQLLAGHCFLSRRALYLLAQHRCSFAELIDTADSESGPFGDHLRSLLTKLGRRPELRLEMRKLLKTGHCEDRARHRLIAGGMIVERHGKVVPRNDLYKRYFSRVLLD